MDWIMIIKILKSIDLTKCKALFSLMYIHVMDLQ